MRSEAAIEIESLSKNFGDIRAVQDLSFAVSPGKVTGFLGPNGSGKTTTLRMLLGLIRATSGTALIGGKKYADLERPAQVVGAALEASSFHPGRSGLNHLRVYAPQIGATDARCHELLEFVGLGDAKDRRVGGYSMGMRQRLALAFALLGDPSVIILDEPANGLDPQGIVWLRQLLRAFADQGRTVLVSSHVLVEVQSTVDDVVIIARGEMVHSSTLAGLKDLAEKRVLIDGPDRHRLGDLARDNGWTFTTSDAGVTINHVEAAEVGARAFASGLELHQLTDADVGLEDVFLGLTNGQDRTSNEGVAS